MEDVLDLGPIKASIRGDSGINVLIVDDDPSVHEMTKLVLSSVTVDDRPLNLLSAYSLQGAKATLTEKPDVAVALIDIVMESQHAGLELIDWIRNSLKNQSIRLILCTGQSESLDKIHIIKTFDINDYLEKSELSSIRLVTTMYCSLRSYKNIVQLVKRTEELRNSKTELEDLYLSANKIHAGLIEDRIESNSANQAKSVFLANISHELRTPMHAILSFSDLGIRRSKKESADSLLKYFQRVHISGQRLLSSLNDLLDLSTLESGLMNLTIIRCDINALVAECVEDLTDQLEKKNLRLIVKQDIVQIIVNADLIRLKQVLRNLISNAIKFTADGKCIQIILRLSTLLLDNPILKQHGETISALHVIIEDEGIGVPPGEVDQVFQKFVQSSRTNSGAGGTGLGLAISMYIIDIHFGKIWAGNSAMGGASFQFLLPLQVPDRSNP